MCLAFAWRESGKPRKHLRIISVRTDIWNLDILYTKLYLHLTTTFCRSASNNVLRVAPYGTACIVIHQYCDTPVLWHSSIVTLQYCDTPVLWHSSIVTIQYCDTPVLWHSSILTLQYCDTAVLWHSCIVTLHYSSSDLQRQGSFFYRCLLWHSPVQWVPGVSRG